MSSGLKPHNFKMNCDSSKYISSLFKLAITDSEIRCIALSVLQISGFSVPSIILAELKSSWFVIRDCWVSIRFVCFLFQGLLLCDRPLSGNNNRLVKFASQIFLIFLILVTCENKATSASFLRQKIHPPSRFPSLFLSSLVICINPAFTKMIDGTGKPKVPSKLEKNA